MTAINTITELENLTENNYDTVYSLTISETIRTPIIETPTHIIIGSDNSNIEKITKLRNLEEIRFNIGQFVNKTQIHKLSKKYYSCGLVYMD